MRIQWRETPHGRVREFITRDVNAPEAVRRINERLGWERYTVVV